MAATLIRKWFEDLCQPKIGAITPLVLCGIVLGTVIGLHKPPAAAQQGVPSSSGQVYALPGRTPAVSAALQPPQSELVAQGQPAQPYANPSRIFREQAPNAYNILEPDWGGTSYRLKTIVNQ